MQEPNYASSKDRLNELVGKYQTEQDQQTIHRMEREIERQMDQFDINERERAAKVAEEFSKIVITA